MAQLSDDRTAFGGKLTHYDQAWEAIGQDVRPLQRHEEVIIAHAHGRFLAADILSERDVPPHDNVAVDGYAFGFDSLNSSSNKASNKASDKASPPPVSNKVSNKASDKASPPPVSNKVSNKPMKIVADIRAGENWQGTLRIGQAVRIFTGAPMPQGADTVMMLEDCHVDGDNLSLTPGIRRGDNRRRMGEDIRHGDVIVRRGQRLRAQDIGLMASIGRGNCTVWKKPRIGIFSCGNELSSDRLKDAEIYDSNRYVLAILAQELGMEVEDGGILPDDPAIITQQLSRAAKKCDMVLTSGGMSTGEGDYIRHVVENLGAIDFWRLAIRPGRPLAMGRIGTTPFAGVPGNPVAAMVTFLIFVRPLLDVLLSRPKRRAFAYPLPATFDYRKKHGRREWLRGVLCRDDEDHPAVDRFAKSGAGILTSLAAADGLIEVTEDVTRIQPGDTVSFLPFRELLW